MNQRNVVCGVDIHKRFLIATILTSTGERITERFSHDLDSLFRFKEWLISHRCERVAVESTGVYWYPVYHILEGTIEVTVANAYHIKHIPGRKTDILDSEWIAQLALSGLIEPSRIFPQNDRELRDLTRHRESLVKARTDQKNRVHRVLDSACIKLSSVLSNLFGKAGMVVIKGLLNGEDIDKILEKNRSKILKRKEMELREAIKSELSPAQIFVIGQGLEIIDEYDRQIMELDATLVDKMKDKMEDLKILMSVPGIQFIGAATLIAEIGNYSDFSTPDKLASWCGITPSVYQSADKLVTGRITKQGSKHIRWILVQIAQAASNTRDTLLKKFFLRIKYRAGHAKAVVALARKILCIIWHLLMKRELYTEEDASTRKNNRIPLVHIGDMRIRNSIDILVKAGYTVRKTDKVPDLKGLLGG